jgi:hypothetical protein
LAYFMKIRSEMRRSESGHVTTITEPLPQAGETTQSPDKKEIK